MYFETRFLYARPSFLEGAARLFDFTGSLNRYNVARSPRAADEAAMWLDWLGVGHDIQAAMKQFDEKQEEAPAAK